MSSTYINGYVKDQPLKNLLDDEVFSEFRKFNESFGRKALKHNSKKVVSTQKSIQGEWTNNLWN